MMHKELQGKLKTDGPKMAAWAFGMLCLLALAAKLVSENLLPGPVEQPGQVSPELKKLQNQMVSGQIVRAKEGLIEYTKEHPDEALSHALLGQAYALVGAHGTAIDSLKIAAALEPTNSRHRFLLAGVYKAIGWTEREEEQYTQILIEEPDNLNALAARMEANFLLGRLLVMLEDAKYAIRVHPQDPRAHLLHGRMQMVMGNYDKAIESFKFVEAIGNDGQRESALTWRGQIEASVTTRGQ